MDLFIRLSAIQETGMFSLMCKSSPGSVGEVQSLVEKRNLNNTISALKCFIVILKPEEWNAKSGRA